MLQRDRQVPSAIIPPRDWTLAMAMTLFAVAGAHAASTPQLEAHVHGQGELNVAVDAEDLQVELKVPADNVVGFEHAPNTPEQHARVDASLDRLVAPANWLKIQPAGTCKLEHASVELLGERRSNDQAATPSTGAKPIPVAATRHDEGKAGAHDEKHDHAHEQKHEQKHDHAHEQKHEEKHDHGHEHKNTEDESTHSELHAEYHFQCSTDVQPAALV